jgi:GNAT superfamily N-acetyltransferase
MKTSKRIHEIIIKEPWFKNADGTFVSESWVSKRKRISMFERGDVTAFLLYDINKKESSIYIHFLWVRKDQRKQGLATTLIENLLTWNDKCKVFVGYANQNSVKLFKKFGFSLSKIKYREVFLRR